jgi:hypothetical protein
MKRRHPSSLINNESGLAAIIVTIILMLVVSLITLSFASIARREQTQTLDRNLSSRAFYAAESGVNIAMEAIANDPASYINGKTNCGPDNSPLTAADFAIDAASQTEVTCLLINRTPPSIEFQNLSKDSRVFPLYTADDTPVSTLFINWQSSSPVAPDFSGCPGSGQFPQTWSATCAAPVLRIDLVPTGGNSLSTDGLANSAFTAFIFPGSVNQTQTYGGGVLGANQGVVFTGLCDGSINDTSKPYYCQASINGLTDSKYFVRIQSFYGAANTILTAGPNASTHKPLIGAQVVIDSTGKAVDVLRRIQVRKPLVQNVGVPDFGFIAAAGVCKLYNIIPGSSDPVRVIGITERGNPAEPCSID